MAASQKSTIKNMVLWPMADIIGFKTYSEQNLPYYNAMAEI